MRTFGSEGSAAGGRRKRTADLRTQMPSGQTSHAVPDHPGEQTHDLNQSSSPTLIFLQFRLSQLRKFRPRIIITANKVPINLFSQFLFYIEIKKVMVMWGITDRTTE